MGDTKKNYSPAALAYLGDAVYEELVRERLLREANRPVRILHKMGIEKVRASYQAEAIAKIAPILTEEETDIVRRGRNSGGANVPKSSNLAEYGAATSLETLFGYLKMQNNDERIKEIFDLIY
ncbi:MAG: ribonuclease III [Ruminococcus sp.]|jgi:ribonuclease-3 family protein|nr:ribonuclease III [Ruminococcus sp.]